MAELLLVNPRRRKRRKSRKSAARASNSRRRRKHTKLGAVSSHKRRVNPRRRSRRKRNPVAFINPRRRRRSITAGVRRVRRRRNPSLRGAVGGLTSSFVPTVKSAFIGAGGAIGLDLMWGYGKNYLPASIAGSALAQYATKLVGAILVGMIANKVPGLRGRGREMAVGAATVVLHDALKAQLQAFAPTLQLGEYLQYAPSVGTMPRAGRLLSTGLDGIQWRDDDMNYQGEYTGDGMNGVGEYMN